MLLPNGHLITHVPNTIFSNFEKKVDKTGMVGITIMREAKVMNF